MKLFLPTCVCNAILFMTASLLAGGVAAQVAVPKPPAAGCPEVRGLHAAQLYGVWAVRFENPPPGFPATATMRLQQHAEFTESLAGTVSRDFGKSLGTPAIAGHSAKAALAGDFESDGVLLLDESSNNINITGTWNGEAVPGSCNRIFRGTWKDTSSSAPADAPDVPFVLRKVTR